MQGTQAESRSRRCDLLRESAPSEPLALRTSSSRLLVPAKNRHTDPDSESSRYPGRTGPPSSPRLGCSALIRTERNLKRRSPAPPSARWGLHTATYGYIRNCDLRTLHTATYRLHMLHTVAKKKLHTDYILITYGTYRLHTEYDVNICNIQLYITYKLHMHYIRNTYRLRT